MKKAPKINFKKIDPSVLAGLCDSIEQHNMRLAKKQFVSVSTGGFELRLTREK